MASRGFGRRRIGQKAMEPNDLAHELTTRLTINKTAQPTLTKKGLIHKIKSKLESYNFHSNWIHNNDIFQKDARSVYEILTDKFSEIARQDDESELKYSALEVIGRKLTQVYLAAYLGLFGKMETFLREANALVNHCCNPEYNYVSIEYLPGLTYCLTGLEAYYLVRTHHCAFKRLENIYKTMGDFTLLTVKEQVGVLAIKQSFIGHIDRKSYEEQSQVTDKMIELDPTNGDWHHWRHNVLRFQRRRQWTFQSPSKCEVEAIVVAAKLSPKNPRILITLYATMAQIVRNSPKLIYKEDIFGVGRILESSVEIVLFLKSATRKVLVLDPLSVKVNITAAEIFSSILPYKFLDVVFAKLCIERALLFHPNSSKANGRMGLFVLSYKQNRREAIKYFVRSFEVDRRNFTSLMELLYCYLSEHTENSRSIESILSLQLTNSEWTEENFGRLYFVKGLHCYMQWKHKETLDSWIMTYKLCGNFSLFKSVPNFRCKYGWSTESFNLQEMCSIITTPNIRWKYSTAETKILREISATIIQTIGKEKCFMDNPRPSLVFQDNSGRNLGNDLRRGGFRGPGAQWLSRNVAPKVSSPSPSRSNFSEILTPVQESPPSAGNALEILGLKPGAPLVEVKKAYRKLCFEVHPDKNPGINAEANEEKLDRMKKINIAYEELTCKWVSCSQVGVRKRETKSIMY